MRVHVTRHDCLFGDRSEGDFEVIGETEEWYQIKKPFFPMWVPKERCQIVTPVKS